MGAPGGYAGPMAGDDNMRIGDSEREAAVADLQNHLAAGRLTPEEFNERMDKAFAARTGAELTALFRDLPAGGASPYQAPAVPTYGDPYRTLDQSQGPQDPAAWGAPSGELQDYRPARPWYAQWWILMIAIVLTGALDGAWFLVPLTAIWIWVIWPSMHRNPARQVQQAAPPRPLTYSERDEIILSLHSQGEVAAIKRYRELTGADLYTATMTVRAINRELGS